MNKNLKEGDTLACKECGMTLEVMVACNCGDDCPPKLECCGKPLERADVKTQTA